MSKASNTVVSQRSPGEPSFVIDVPIFSMEILCYFGQMSGFSDFIEDKAKVKIEGSCEGNDGMLINLEKNYHCTGELALAVDSLKKKLEGPAKVLALGTLSHECLHAATAIMEDRGIDVSFTNDEVIAYLQEWIFESILKEFE